MDEKDTKSLLKAVVDNQSRHQEFMEQMRIEDRKEMLETRRHDLEVRRQDKAEMSQLRESVQTIAESTTILTKITAENSANNNHVNSQIDSIHDTLVTHDTWINELKTRLAVKNGKLVVAGAVCLILLSVSGTWWLSTGKPQADQTEALNRTMEGVNKTNELMEKVVDIMDENYSAVKDAADQGATKP